MPTHHDARHCAQELLPLSIRPALTEDDFAKVAQLRATAYGRHDYLEAAKNNLRHVDELDRVATCFLAEDKRTGEALGTVRIASSLAGPTALPQAMPDGPYHRESFAYVDRFATAVGPEARLTTLGLMKAVWKWAEMQGVEWLVAAARKPLARRYELVGLRRVGESEDKVFALETLHTQPYYALATRVHELVPNIRKDSPFMLPFFVDVEHPDIQVS